MVLQVVQAVELVELARQAAQRLAVKETRAATAMLYQMPSRAAAAAKRQPEGTQIQAR
jgi:hypothetical protein